MTAQAAAGLDRLAAGVYVDAAGTLHLSVPELLEHHGYQDTPSNRETLVKAAVECFDDLCGADVAVEVHD